MAVTTACGSFTERPIEKVMEEGEMALTSLGQPAGDLGDHSDGSAPFGNGGQCVVGVFEVVQVRDSSGWGCLLIRFKAIAEGIY